MVMTMMHWVDFTLMEIEYLMENALILVIQPNGANIEDYVGVISLFQCGTFSTTGEGVYTCVIMNSSMTNQSFRLGIYFTGRSESINSIHTYI